MSAPSPAPGPLSPHNPTLDQTLATLCNQKRRQALSGDGGITYFILYVDRDVFYGQKQFLRFKDTGVRVFEGVGKILFAVVIFKCI